MSEESTHSSRENAAYGARRTQVSQRNLRAER